MAQMQVIGFDKLAIMLIPLTLVALIYWRMTRNWKDISIGLVRMVSQLILVGFALNAIFKSDDIVTITLVFTFMLTVAAWIATRKVSERKKQLPIMLKSLAIGCTPILLLVLILIIPHEPWYKGSYFIPLAGMILSNSMNSLALAADRLNSSTSSLHSKEEIKKSFETALIPTINSFYAVGLVSLPGMMTGQILSGISPLVAVRYQIVVMAMVLSASGLSVAFYLFKNNEFWRK